MRVARRILSTAPQKTSQIDLAPRSSPIPFPYKLKTGDATALFVSSVESKSPHVHFMELADTPWIWGPFHATVEVAMNRMARRLQSKVGGLGGDASAERAGEYQGFEFCDYINQLVRRSTSPPQLVVTNHL